MIKPYLTVLFGWSEERRREAIRSNLGESRTHSAIVRDLQARAVAAGKPIEWRVFITNERARRLYERLGFVEFDRTEHDVGMRIVPAGAEKAVGSGQ